MKLTNNLTLIFMLCVNFLSATNYTITDISTKGADAYFASDINQKGQVTGACRGIPKTHLYLWDKSNGFAFIEGSGSVAMPGYPPYVNDNGTVSMRVIANSGDTYFVKDNKLFKNNSAIESSIKWKNDENIAVKANNNGQIIGTLDTEENRNVIVMYDERSKKTTYIKSPFKYALKAEDINDFGWVIGSYYDGVSHNGILWTPEFGIQILQGFRPIAMNNLGVIVGITIPQYDIWQKYTRAVLWDKGILVDLSKELNIDSDPTTKLLWISVITGINDNNQMCGCGPTTRNTPDDRQPVFISPIN